MIERRTVWLLAVVTTLCGVADTAINAAFRPLLSLNAVAVHGWPLATMATIGASWMGALIISRYPRHTIGWLLTLVGVISAIGLLAESYDLWVVDHDGPGSNTWGHFGGWLSLLFSAPVAFTGFTLMLLLAPDGRLLSPRWRIPAGVAVAGLVAWTAGVCLTPFSATEIDTDATGGSVLAGALFVVGLLLSLAAMVVSVVSVVIRRHRAQGIVAQQLKWITVWSFSLPFGLGILLALNGADHGPAAWLARMPLMISYATLPVCLAIAVLRYRLYDIDLIINRAVVLASGTAFAAVGYIALVVSAGALVNARSDGFWPSLIATGAVALAFQPLRRGVVRIADRFAYGARAAPYEALASFSRRLGESPETGSLLPVVAQAAVHAVSAQSATVRLHIPNDRDLVATWPAGATPADDTTEFEVNDQGEPLGAIAVRMPVGRALRATDHRLLRDLARQTALAFRNARLSAELARQVDLLDHRTQELAVSRARVIEARDAESARLERAIRRDVISHLDHLPVQLKELSLRVCDGAAEPTLSVMIDDSVAALESLRTLTRGIYSTQLARFGLCSAISAHLRRTDPGAAFTADDTLRTRRFDDRIESAAYFCYVTAVRELHAPLTVELGLRRELLMITVRSSPSADLDLLQLQDRLDPLAGNVAWTHTSRRSVLTMRVPLPV